MIPAAAIALALVALPIQTNSGFTAYEGQWIVRSQVRVHRRDDDPSPMRRRLTAIEVPVTLAYGVTSRWTAIGVVPFVSKDLDLDAAGGRTRRGDAGLGDVTALLKYRLWTRDEPGARTTRLSLIGGATIPTGADDATDALGRLPRPLQVGRGSASAHLGAVATRWTPFSAVTADAVWRSGGEDEGYEFGDVLAYDVAYERAIWPRELPEEGLPDYLYAIVELNGEVAGRDRVAGVADANTGGHVLHVSPGLQFVTPRYAVEAAVEIPIVTDLRDLQPEPDWTFVLSHRFSW